jgi:exosortase/archaeosortase family protein
MLKGFVKNVGEDLKSKKGLHNAGRFLLVFLTSFLVFVLILIPLSSGFWEGLGSFHASASAGVLAIFGVESSVNGNVLTMDVRGEGVDFWISQLCSGDIEVALLVSLLLATLDILLIWRVLGAILGGMMLILLNPLRISITLMITKDSGMYVGEFYHSIIFRLFLFVLLVLYYLAWYRLFVGRKSSLQDRICKKIGC